MIEIVAQVLLPILQIVSIFALPVIFIKSFRSPDRMPWGLRLEFAVLFLITAGLAFMAYERAGKYTPVDENTVAYVQEVNQALLQDFILADPAMWIPFLDFADPTKGFAAVALIVLLAWIFGKPVYVLAKWALSGFRRPDKGLHPVTSALMPVMIIFAPIMFVLVGGQMVLDAFGLVIGTILSIVSFVGLLAVSLLFLGGFGDFMRRRR